MFRILGKKIFNGFTLLLQNRALVIAWNIILAEQRNRLALHLFNVMVL